MLVLDMVPCFALSKYFVGSNITAGSFGDEVSLQLKMENDSEKGKELIINFKRRRCYRYMFRYERETDSKQ
jgi:hypothetical protein